MKNEKNYLNMPISATLRNSIEIATIIRVKFNDSIIRSAYLLIGALFQENSIIANFFSENGYFLDASEILSSIISYKEVFASILGEELCNYFFGIEDEEEKNTIKKEKKKNRFSLIKKNVKEYVDNLINEQYIENEIIEYFLDVSTVYSQNALDALEMAATKCVHMNSKILGLDEVLYYLLKNDESSAHKLMKTVLDANFNDSFSINDLLSYMENNCSIVKELDTKTNTCYIPAALENCCEVLNNKYKEGQKCDILGRESELKQLWNIISKKTKRNSILVGPPGVGKTAIVEALTQQIVNKECPKEFLDYNVISFDIDSLVAGTKYRGEFETKVVLLKKFINSTPNIILFIDEIHRTRGAGASEGGISDLSGALKPILSRDDAIIIGTTTDVEYKIFIESDKAYKRRFEVVEVKEPKSCYVHKMVNRKVKKLENYHNVKLSKGVLKYIISASACFNVEAANPDKTLDLCDRAMVIAKNEGCYKVVKEHVKKVFADSFERYNKIGKDNIEIIAYHEAAHYVVARLTSAINMSDVIAISILPTNSFLGVNVLEENENSIINDKYMYYDEICTLLAGRAIEEKKFNIIDSGALSDIEKATSIAKYIITRLGMDNDIGTISYGVYNSILDVSEDNINLINKKVTEILSNQYIRAKEILTKNMEFVNMVAKKLIKDCIISKEELDKMYKEYVTVT